MKNARMDEAQAVMKIARRNISNLRYTDDSTLMAEGEEELERLLMKVKEESEKAGLKLNIQKIKIMESSPITSWQMKQWKQCQTLFFWAPKLLQMVTVASKLIDACSSEKSYYKTRRHIEKQRYHLADKGLSSEGYAFSSGHVWM